MAPNEQVICKTTDGDEVNVDIDLIRQSKTVDQMLKDLDMGSEQNADEEKKPISFPVQVSTAVLEKVVEWCKEHKGRS